MGITSLDLPNMARAPFRPIKYLILSKRVNLPLPIDLKISKKKQVLTIFHLLKLFIFFRSLRRIILIKQLLTRACRDCA